MKFPDTFFQYRYRLVYRYLLGARNDESDVRYQKVHTDWALVG